jgi:hypothetical protein
LSSRSTTALSISSAWKFAGGRGGQAGVAAVQKGGAQLVQPTDGDLFRHWLLGFGSGDLLVSTSGANAQRFERHNILFVGGKLKLIQRMLKTREVVVGA